jgi:hypothetical protein
VSFFCRILVCCHGCNVIVYVQKNKFKVSRRSGSGRGRTMFDEETIPASSPLLCFRVGVVSDFLMLRHKLFSYFRFYGGKTSVYLLL